MRPFTAGGAAVDPRALVSPDARLDEGVQVGPFAVIGKNVRIGAGSIIGPHAVVEGRTTLGRDTRVFQFASIGSDPQDLKFRDEDTELVAGDGNVFRECSTVHKGTVTGNGVTRMGNGNLVMAYVHIAHDCVIGDGAIFANCATLAGHVEVGDGAFFGGLSGAHQFCRIGALAMVGAGSVVVQDVPPYTMVQGDHARLMGLNLIGLDRKGFPAAAIAALKAAYKTVFQGSGLRRDALAKARAEVGSHPEAAHFLDFIEASKRGVVR
jgi:UDP-N-acetylglucosamine acyltransferase